MKQDNPVELFLDSGAFSAKTKGVDIKIEDYIQFIKDNADFIFAYSVLDSIGDPKQTLKNQKIMEKSGLHPVPCFHYGEPEKYLQYYVENYDYISLGGMVPISTPDLTVWLDRMFQDYICDESGMPKVKVHGFGMTVLNLLWRYPWWSVDSTSWIMTGRFGSVLVPRRRDGVYIYNENPLKICVSHMAPSMKEQGAHYFSLTAMERKEIDEYFSLKGFGIGYSEFRNEDRKTYILNKEEGEKWYNFDDADHCRELILQFGNFVPSQFLAMRDWVEVVKTPGLMNDYTKRDELNIVYFLDLEKNMPQWPWPFKIKKKVRGFSQRVVK